MAHEKKTPKGWEIWSQPGQPTERFVTLVENESTARTLVEILSYQDEDALPEKTAYVEMVGELNLDDPEYAEYRVDADLVREAAAVLEAINGFGLTEARRNTNAVVWHGADTRITGDEIAAAGGYFWMTAYVIYIKRCNIPTNLATLSPIFQPLGETQGDDHPATHH